MADGYSFRPWFEPVPLAVHPTARGTRIPLPAMLAGWAVGRIAYGATALTLVTGRHDTARILRTLGHQPAIHNGTAIGPVFDPRYGCEMHLT